MTTATLTRPLLQQAVDRLAARAGTALQLRLPGGRLIRAGDGPSRFTLVARDWSVLPAVALRRHLGLIEAYIDGRVDVEGDLAAAFAAGLKAGVDVHPGWIARLENRLHEWRHANGALHRARDNARAHYGFPEPFYRLWLDAPLKMYTCGYWPDGTATLEDAQQRKIDHVCRKIRLAARDHVLDIGCGFGGFMLRAARTTGARATGINTTPEQAQWLREEIARQGLERQLTVREQDFRHPGGPYNKLVSIGVLEHAGRGQLDAVLRAHAEALEPGGLGLLHFIGHVGRHDTDPFIRKHVFPGGWIPALADVLPAMERFGLEVLDIENLRRHYALTLDEWACRFEARWPEIQALDPERFDERFRRLWRCYLVGCAETFRAPNGGTHLFQIVFSKGNVTERGYPMSRDFLHG